MKIYAVWDKKSKTFSAPFVAPHDVDVVRGFKDLGADHKFRKYPEDFEVHVVGYWEPEQGIMIDDTNTKSGMLTTMTTLFETPK